MARELTIAETAEIRAIAERFVENTSPKAVDLTELEKEVIGWKASVEVMMETIDRLRTELKEERALTVRLQLKGRAIQ